MSTYLVSDNLDAAHDKNHSICNLIPALILMMQIKLNYERYQTDMSILATYFHYRTAVLPFNKVQNRVAELNQFPVWELTRNIGNLCKQKPNCKYWNTIYTARCTGDATYLNRCKMEYQRTITLEEVLTVKQICHIVNQGAGAGGQLVGSEVKPATLGLSGFLGDHFRATLHVKVKDGVRSINIFVKSLPLSNKPKAKFIDENNYYRREMLMFQLFNEMKITSDDLWCAKAYICSDNIVVMPDLSYQGYCQRPQLDCLDLKHTLLTTASVARFHAAFANYETKRKHEGCEPFIQKYAKVLKEPTFLDSPWLHAAAKLTKNFLAAFSNKWHQYPTNLEEILVRLYIEGCASLTECDSLNVVNHKDLWVNNIMFKCEGGCPTNALLIDFQCIRYGPPAFDIMIFLYLNTSRSFRERYEAMLFRQYYTVFLEDLDDSTKERLKALGYDFNEFLWWCNEARMFGMVVTMTILPYVLMEPSVAQKTFDDPETYMKYCMEDRTEPVVAHAKECVAYKERQLEVCEEFLERYVLKRL